MDRYVHVQPPQYLPPASYLEFQGKGGEATMGVVKKLATSPLTRRVAAAILLGLAEHLRDVMRQGR